MLPDPAKRRLTGVFLGCMALAGALGTRAAYLQLKPHQRLEQMARRQFQSRVLIQPRRGLILDRNGEPLAANRESNSLAANPLKVKTRKTLARLLSKATDMPYSKVLQRLEEKKEFAWIKRHLTESDMNRLKKWGIIDSGGDIASGLWLVKESRRAFPHNELAAHVLGDVNIDSEGLEGIELSLNERLRGKVVSVSAIKDALGRPAYLDAVNAKDAQEGRDGEPVSLTLDASLQFAVEEELRNSVRKHGAKAGSVIVMNAVTGEILAMANQPAFNPNEKGNSPEQRRNRALTDGYEPGSTMKAVLLAGALSHGQKLSDQVYGELGSFKVQGKKISEAEAHEKFRWISLKKVIQVSSNVGAAKIALKLGAENYFNTIKAFGFGSKTGSGFPGEISGKFPLRKNWTPLSVANIGFGQGILVTPMQMLRAYATFLNGGWLVQPTLVKMPAPQSVEPPRRILTQKVSEQVLEALMTVTQEGGTGMKADLPGYRTAGKTGTAQKIDPASGGYSRSKFVSSFIGFALDVEPRIAIFTSLDEPRGIYYASDTAAPLFREVLSAVANRFGLPTREGTKPVLAHAKDSLPQEIVKTPVVVPADTEIDDSGTKQDSLDVSQARAVDDDGIPDDLRWQGNESGRFLWKMPALHSLTPREAMKVLKGHHFQVQIHGVGVIHSQSPEQGKVIADGDTVRLTLAEP